MMNVKPIYIKVYFSLNGEVFDRNFKTFQEAIDYLQNTALALEVAEGDDEKTINILEY